MKFFYARFVLNHILLQREHVMLHKVVQDQVFVHPRFVNQAANVFDFAARQFLGENNQQVANRLISLQRKEFQITKISFPYIK